MIVAETPDAYRFVTQPDHAALAGTFAARWDNDRFERPEPFAAVALAADAHDDGWLGYDRRPHLCDDGTPVNFTELTAETWTGLYDRTVDALAGLDRYAALLVSMHGTGLRRRRYGLSPAWPDTPDGFEAFVDRQEARQRELLDAMAADEKDDRVSPGDDALLAALHDTGVPPDDTASRLWANYRLLQTWDTLSLAFCRTTAPPAHETIEGVPRRPDGEDATLSIAADEAGTVTVSPYPFDRSPVSADVRARTVPKRAAGTEADLAEAYHAADRERLRFELRRPR